MLVHIQSLMVSSIMVGGHRAEPGGETMTIRRLPRDRPTRGDRSSMPPECFCCYRYIL